MSEGTSSKPYEKIPTFDGEKDSWEFYKIQMESYLATHNLGDLTVRMIGERVRHDDYVAPANTSQEDLDAISSLQSKNRKAAGILLRSISTKTTKGRAAFRLVKKHHISTGNEPMSGLGSFLSFTWFLLQNVARTS